MFYDLKYYEYFLKYKAYANCISKCHKRNRIILFFSKAKNLSIASLWFCFLTQIKEKRNYLYMTDGDSTGITNEL